VRDVGAPFEPAALTGGLWTFIDGMLSECWISTLTLGSGRVEISAKRWAATRPASYDIKRLLDPLGILNPEES